MLLTGVSVACSMEPTDVAPFADLPQALVDDMLGKSGDLGGALSSAFREMQGKKSHIRAELEKRDLLKSDSEYIKTSRHPTTCGIDGSWAIERLLGTDIVAVAGVAVEGLTPPTNKRFWPLPRHFSDVATVGHSERTAVVSRGITALMELELAAKAPHDVVFLDGSMSTPFIFLNQALGGLGDVPDSLSRLLTGRLEAGTRAYREVLASPRSDRAFVAIPKYTSKKEISNMAGLQYDDRGLLSFVLKAGEVVGPVPMEGPRQPWHIGGYPDRLGPEFEAIKAGLYGLHVMYYRPYSHSPALRLEVPKSAAASSVRTAIVLEAVKAQCGSPGIMEPYPTYMADRMVKHLGRAVPAIRRAATQEMAGEWEDDIGSVYFAMHGYRTESR